MRAVTIAVCAIGALVLVATASGGVARFSGLRWRFTLSPPPVPRPSPLRPPLGAPSPAPLPSAASHETPLWLIIALWVLVAVVVVLLVRLLVRHLPRPVRRTAEAIPETGPLSEDLVDEAGEDEEVPDAPVVRRGIAEALTALDAGREPADAIVAAWLGLQESAEDAGLARRPAETPTEFTRRMLGRVTSDTAAVDTILRLYLPVRFGDHPATTADVQRVRVALLHLESSWRSEAAR